MPDQRQGSVSPRLEQWTVVDPPITRSPGHTHRFRLVTLRSNLGRFSPGMFCPDCQLVERLTDRQLASHGRRVERSKQ